MERIGTDQNEPPMSYYNPIVRTFCRIRAALVELGVDRRDVTPQTPLATIAADVAAVELRSRLAEKGLRRARSLFSGRGEGFRFPMTLRASIAALVCGILTLYWMGGFAALFLPPAYALVLLVWWIERRALPRPNPAAHSVWWPGLRTVGDLTIWLTDFKDHKLSGYRFTRNEFSLKVRLIVADQTGLSVDSVTEETLFLGLTDGPW